MSSEVPEGWASVHLGNLIRLEYGRALSASMREPGDIPVYGSNGICGEHSAALVFGRGIVVGRKGTAGSVTVTNGPFWPIDTTYFVVPRVEVDFDWLATTLEYSRLSDLNEATGVPGLNRDKAYLQPILLPPIDEQRRIAELLRSVDEALLTANAVLTTSKRVMNAYMQAAFADVADEVNGTPLEELLERIIDYRGVPPPKSETGVPLITAKNVRLGYLDPEPREFIAAADYASWMRRGIPSPGDILFTTEAPLGFVAEFPEYRAALGQRTITLVAKPDRLNRPYLKWLLLSPPVQEVVHRHGTGSTAKGIKQSTFRKLRFSVPSVDKQKAISSICEDIWRVVESARAAKDRLLATKDLIAYDLLSGRVRVTA